MKKLIPLLLLLAGTAWGQQTIIPRGRGWYNPKMIGSACVPFTAHEFHILPLEDTTIIYLHYADGRCDTIYTTLTGLMAWRRGWK